MLVYLGHNGNSTFVNSRVSILVLDSVLSSVILCQLCVSSIQLYQVCTITRYDNSFYIILSFIHIQGIACSNGCSNLYYDCPLF